MRSSRKRTKKIRQSVKGEELAIYERFNTFQGEGVHAGKHAFFIRTFGCPIKCPWCDSAGTWHHDYIPNDINKVSVEKLADEAEESGARICVITGGEPAIHDLTLLCKYLHSREMNVHLETSGAIEPLRGEFDWITVSPKKEKPPSDLMMGTADEIKIIVDSEIEIGFWVDKYKMVLSNRPNVWLHPEWSQKANPTILKSIIDAVKEHGFRAGYQLHKLYLVDALDKRSRPLVPLGGNIDNGY